MFGRLLPSDRFFAVVLIQAAIAGVMWGLSMLSRKVSLAEMFGLLAYWAVLAAVVGWFLRS